ncbi:MAG: hypothetical protein JNK87_39820 [Bryobacterales bacterium]|nr:hypothetical protein [Bryobacterales bacterium]
MTSIHLTGPGAVGASLHRRADALSHENVEVGILAIDKVLAGGGPG